MPPPPRRTHYVPVSRGGYRRRSSMFTLILMALVIFWMVIMFGGVSFINTITGTARGMNSSEKNTIVREKLDTGNAYINDCIIDELGWFDNTSKTAAELKSFWEKTGVQPYIILKAYDSSLTGDSEKEEWTTNYYDENFTAENIFLYVYFAEENTDNDVGYMCYANGMQTSSVMDSEAVEIFWNYIDRYWYADMSTDDVFVNAFSDTANTIMHVSTNGWDVLKWVFIVIAIIAAGAVVIILVNKRNQRKKEEAAEAQKILETPINDIADDKLENKYL